LQERCFKLLTISDHMANELGYYDVRTFSV